MRSPIIVAFGGGTDSTAMLIGMVEKNLPVDLILFADTGGEKPHTYEHVKNFSNWLKDKGYPEITIVRSMKKDGTIETLEEDCLRRKVLPSIAFGFKTCSSHYKIQPQDKFLNNWKPAKDAWANGLKVIKLIGYDVSEDHRIKDYSDKKYQMQYPLVEWNWDRQECIKAIDRANIPRPGKSACFFCPSTKPKEIVEIYKQYPKLIERAIEMENNADLTHIKGLGRNYSWKNIIWAHTSQMELPLGGFDIPCECWE